VFLFNIFLFYTQNITKYLYCVRYGFYVFIYAEEGFYKPNWENWYDKFWKLL